MPEEKFKLPWSSYDELIKIIRAYGHVTQAVGLGEASKLSGLNTTTISSNNGFLAAVGILESGAKKVPTPQGKELSQALEYNMPEPIANCWRKIVGGNDFFEKLLTSIKIRNGMDEETLESHIAYSAGQPKKDKVMTGARTVVDILRAALLVTEADGKITTITGSPENAPFQQKGGMKEEHAPQSKNLQTPSPDIVAGLDMQLNIHININCTPLDMEGLPEKLKIFIKEISLNPGNNPASK